jgi:hypothetical protein
MIICEWAKDDVHACQEGGIWKVVVRSSPGKELARLHPSQQKKLGVVVRTCHLNYVLDVSRITVQVGLGKICKTLPEK